jgi:hypothetical protein
VRLAVSLIFLCLATASAVNAEMYKCQGPDGKTLYTSDRSQCPGTQVHDLKGQVQSAGSSAPARTRRRSPAASPAANEAGRRQWQQKKREGEAVLRESRSRLAYLEKMVTACNRGAELYVEDDDTGIRKGYPCHLVKEDYATAIQTVAKGEQFLAEGLEEACRRSGCLPGWIR